MKLLLLIILISLSTIGLRAQSQEEAAVRVALQNYMSAQPDRVEKAFESSAFMQFVDPKTGALKKVPITEYIARLAPATSQQSGSPWKREIASIDIEGNAAQAKIRIDAATMMIYDYMTLLKINGEWKIVSKAFSRVDKASE